ncbi:H-NS family nucleoid-associated regulatory protein, partial [Burkholderia vietnamiensis]|uniref:H-NS family nucleoid-associated regulatory protein n=1 Tax=Burkholderia vietnamiensis TaxID=60552 RepID=UPI0015946403
GDGNPPPSTKLEFRKDSSFYRGDNYFAAGGYRDPKTGATWSGRGRAPAWLVGAKDRSKFLIVKADVTTSEPRAKGAKRGAAARKVSGKKVAAKKVAVKNSVPVAKKATAKKPMAKKVRARKVAAKNVVSTVEPVQAAEASTTSITS